MFVARTTTDAAPDVSVITKLIDPSTNTRSRPRRYVSADTISETDEMPIAIHAVI
jgi:hypothetical protein